MLMQMLMLTQRTGSSHVLGLAKIGVDVRVSVERLRAYSRIGLAVDPLRNSADVWAEEGSDGAENIRLVDSRPFDLWLGGSVMNVSGDERSSFAGAKEAAGARQKGSASGGRAGAANMARREQRRSIGSDQVPFPSQNPHPCWDVLHLETPPVVPANGTRWGSREGWVSKGLWQWSD